MKKKRDMVLARLSTMNGSQRKALTRIARKHLCVEIMDTKPKYNVSGII